MLTDAEPLRNLGHRIPALSDLGHRITLELITEIGLPYRRPCPQNWIKKRPEIWGYSIHPWQSTIEINGFST
jgi:hypothetical protein